MNRIISLIAFLLAILIFSCSTDDEDPVSELIGIWEIAAFEATCTSIESFSAEANDGCINIMGDQLCITITFQENGTGSFSTIIDGDTDIIQLSYTLNGNQVSMCEGGDCNVAVLRDHKLVLEDTEEGCDVEYVFAKI